MQLERDTGMLILDAGEERLVKGYFEAQALAARIQAEGRSILSLMSFPGCDESLSGLFNDSDTDMTDEEAEQPGIHSAIRDIELSMFEQRGMPESPTIFERAREIFNDLLAGSENPVEVLQPGTEQPPSLRLPAAVLPGLEYIAADAQRRAEAQTRILASSEEITRNIQDLPEQYRDSVTAMHALFVPLLGSISARGASDNERAENLLAEIERVKGVLDGEG